ncbi:uncharacterized protein AtWU_03501 [Aspergillus tubingensis]|uniref:uncharacterized protein n=1 Tax=Aspergillus tubingensis TaxID=5068 RepID=UPI001579B695|nr:uncharacterized protein AtWU_03501 [Aspergillus tubingensis]GFN13702.1 hypothetical protein AtWU_03501 [Aspergillus tubingensis]
MNTTSNLAVMLDRDARSLWVLTSSTLSYAKHMDAQRAPLRLHTHPSRSHENSHNHTVGRSRYHTSFFPCYKRVLSYPSNLLYRLYYTTSML